MYSVEQRILMTRMNHSSIGTAILGLIGVMVFFIFFLLSWWSNGAHHDYVLRALLRNLHRRYPDASRVRNARP